MSASTTRLVLRGARSALVGAFLGAVLCVLAYLPALFVDGPADTSAGATRLMIGVVLVGARMGAVGGIIFFLVKRSLTGEVADPRLHN